MVEGQCDAIDINFGCPQKVAKRGHYGAFLMDDWESMVSIVWVLAHRELSVPVTVKVRGDTETKRLNEHTFTGVFHAPFCFGAEYSKFLK